MGIGPAAAAITALAVGGVLAGCGGDPAVTGENVIENELADQIGLGELEASCDEPEDREVGTRFDCTATTEDGRTIEFIGTFTSETEIYLDAINLAPSSAVEVWKQRSAEILEPEVGFLIDVTTIDCPEGDPVFLDTSTPGEAVIDCTTIDPATGESVPLQMTLSDFVSEQGYQTLFAAVGAAVD